MMLLPSHILLASTVFTATDALVLNSTITPTGHTASSTILPRDVTTSSSTVSTSPVYFLATKFITIAGVTNPHATIPAKTVSFAVPTCKQTLTPDQNGYLPPDTCNAIYDYHPSYISTLVFAAIFGVHTFAHIIHAIFYKKACSLFMITSCIWGLTRAGHPDPTRSI